MPSMVPTHTVIVKRDHPKGDKDKEGRVRQVTVVPPIGQAFDFTDEEVEHVQAHRDTGLREPVNEGGDNQFAALNEQVDVAAREAADTAAKTGGAQNDAAVTARAAAIARQTGRKPARDPEVLRENEGQEDDEL